MNNQFVTLERWLQTALRTLSPAGRKRLLRSIMRDISRNNRQRMTRHQDAEGQPWPQRARRKTTRTKNGRVRHTLKMMVGLRTARRLHLRADPESGRLEFRGRTARIASVHHHGLVDKVSARGGPQVKYPERPLLGFSDADISHIRTTLIRALQR